MIYLDHAATSFPKPTAVLAAVERWFRAVGVSAERGDGPACAEVGAAVAEVRTRLGTLCGMAPDRVAFTSGATEALNLFLRGFLRPGHRVLTTVLEHSSLVRPLRALQAELHLEIDVAPIDGDGRVATDDVERRLRAHAVDLVAFSHASNVLGSVQPAVELCALARRHGCATLLDASQSAGLLPLDVGADAVVASAHKSLLAPPGLGFLAVRPELSLRQTKQGGTGSARALDVHPSDWPAAFEAGTPNTPAIIGLRAALEWLCGREAALLAHGLALVDALRQRLAQRRGARLLGPATGPRLPILSFVLDDLDPAEAGALLAEAGIHVRTGFHCAPWLHAVLGTGAAGTVRASTGPFTQAADVLAVAGALAESRRA